ncbi:MAG: hypothetical protein ABI565_00775 [Vicinamibacteria bacterium]
MNQLFTTSTKRRDSALQSDGQEPVFRTLRRSREDGMAASLREAQGRGGPVDELIDPTMPSSLKAKSRWRTQVDDAGAEWSRLTESDLHQLETHGQTLSELIQLRYGLSEPVADLQVLAFIEDHLSSSL